MDGLPTPEQNVAWRLVDVEARLAELTERLGALESSLRGAVAEEVQGATAELRRAMSELGRRLVQDLPHELARHRDAIVAELRPPPPPPPPPLPVPEFEAPADVPPPGPLEDEPEEAPATDAADTPERRRAPRLRRRQN
jgi:uncharacterized protein YukE